MPTHRKRAVFLVFLTVFFGPSQLRAYESGFVTETDLAGHSLGKYPFFQFVRSIQEDRSIEVAVDPSRFPVVVGKGADLYVARSRTRSEWDRDPELIDVRGRPQSVTFGGSTIEENTFTVAGPQELECDAGFSLGVGYDIILDFDHDGLLSGNDFIDGRRGEAGFYRVRNPVEPGPLATSVLEHNGGSFLFQRIFFPQEIRSLEKLPLVVVSHGFTHHYSFYDHLGDHLASYGYIVLCHDNDVGLGGAFASTTASTSTLMNTDYLLDQQAAIGGGILLGHIDSQRIVWVGHSTGGECVVRAYTRLQNRDFVPQHYDAEDIVLISSICPVAFLSRVETDPADANYHMFVAAADTDASGAPISGYYQSMAIYERGVGNKQLTYIQGAGHNDFLGVPATPLASGPDLVGQEAVQTVMLGYFLPLAEFYAKGNPAAQDYFTRPYESFHPLGIPSNVKVATEYRDAASGRTLDVDNFQTQPTLDISSSGGTVEFSVNNVAEVLMRDQNNSFAWDPAQPSNGMTRYVLPGDDPRCVVFDWSATSSEYFELGLTPSLRDLSEWEFLSFRACQGTRHPETDRLDAPLSFTVSLRDSSAVPVTSSIPISNYGHVPRPYPRAGFGPGMGWGNEFTTLRMRLTDFLTNGSGLDLTNVAAIRFDFGAEFGAAGGRIGVDDIQVTRPAVANDATQAYLAAVPQNLPRVAPPNEATAVTVRVFSRGERLVEGSLRLMVRLQGGEFTSISLDSLGDDLFAGFVPAAGCGSVPEFYFSAEGTSSGLVTSPRDAPHTLYRLEVGTAESVTPVLELLDRDPGWSAQGEWQFGPPTGRGGQRFGFPDPSSGATGRNVYGVNLNGDPASLGGPFYLTLGPVDLTGITDATLCFQRWLNFEIRPFAHATVEVSNNGIDWFVIWLSGAGFFEENAWSAREYDISSFADDQVSVYVRWSYQTTAGAFPLSGWNLDDITIRGRRVTPCTDFLRGDVDGDGVLNFLPDSLYLLEFGFLFGDAPNCDDAADVDDDGTTNALIDALYLLTFGFLAGEAPPPPFSRCGPDPTSDRLDCGARPGCL